MANVRPYINHLLQSSGITPACSEEERLAAEDLAQIFRRHGFEPEVQEFSASGARKIVTAVLGIAVFLGAVLMGVGGVIGVIGLLLALAGGVLFTLERMGKTSLSSIGGAGLSQNVIAYHKASGPLASPRNRPVVVVAHYDSPRADLLSQMPYASYRPVIVKALPYAMLAPAVIAVVRLLPLPGAAKVALWLIAILAALVPLANAVATIMNRFVLPYTSGAVCNKSSVAAMLGVMNAVAPFRGEREFPQDVPFGKYMREQRRMAAEAQRAAAEAAAAAAAAKAAKSGAPAEEPAPAAEVAEAAPEATGVSEDLGGTSSLSAEDLAAAGTAALEGVAEAAETASADPGATQAMAMPAEVAAAGLAAAAEVGGAADEPVELIETELIEDELPEAPAVSEDSEVVEEAPEPADDALATEPAPAPAAGVNAEGNYRFGADVIRSLGMVSDSCVLEYDEPVVELEPEPAAEEPVAAPLPVEEAGEPEEASVDEEVLSDEEVADIDYADIDYADDGYDAEDDAYDGADAYDEDGFGDEADYEDDEDAFDGEADYEEDDEFDFSYQPSAYEGGGLSRLGGGGFAERLSAVGAGAARFLSDALSRGKSALKDFESAAHDVADRISSRDEALPDTEDELLPEGDQEELAVEEGPEVVAAAEEEGEAPVDEPTVAYEALTDDQIAELSVEEEQADSEVAADEVVEDEFETVEAEDGDAPVEPAADDAALAQAGEPVEEAPVDNGADSGEPEDAAGAVDSAETDSSSDQQTMGATVAFSAQAAAAEGLEATAVKAPSEPVPPRPVETVDSLMAQISPQRPQRRAPLSVPDPSAPSLNEAQPASRASLFDLPDPSAPELDPFAPQGAQSPYTGSPAAPAPAQRRLSVIDPAAPAAPESPAAPAAGAFEVLSADAPVINRPTEQKPRGLGGLFRRKKAEEPSMGEYLGLGDDFDAKRSGRDIGSWDNFEDDDWKGGATGAEGVSADELRDAVTSLGDDELLGHDIWFVATGASEYDGAGIKAFLATHRDKLRGVFLINLECVGSGQVAMLATEGDRRVLKGDKRIMNLVSKVSRSFHHEFGSVEMPFLATDAYAAMNMSLRSLTIAGIDGPCLACSHSEEDSPLSVDVDNINRVADVVTEVIRRS